MISDRYLKKIHEKSEQLQQTWAQIEQWRTEWNTTSKPLIMNALRQIVEQNQLDWYVGTNEQTQNLEAVYLSFNERQSGIAERTDHGLNILNKQGGYLCFSQLLNGIVQVWLSFPTIEKILENQPDTIIANFLPDNITEDTVAECVEKFLEALLIWEVGESTEKRKQIGFSKE